MPRERIPEVGEAVQRALFGPMDRHLRAVRERYGVRISVRNEVLQVEGEDEASVRDVTRRVKEVMTRMAGGNGVSAEEVEGVLFGVARSRREGARRSPPRPAPRGRGGGATPRPRTPMQEAYVEAIRKHDVVVSIGPAGTGKTFLAVVEAVAALREDRVRRIVLTRPAVEAGEKLGFLPGDFHAKINPYLRPLYDALGELMPWGEVQRFIDADVIEIVPLAYMRGRTLKSAFIILDEAQNTTPAQMKMFLTRFGESSKVVVNGDVTQIDLPDDVSSGLVDCIRIVEGVKGVEVIRFGPADIQRHALVQRIVDAYDSAQTDDPGAAGAGP
jgi:phosphate starvation-inducible PhoH-like protein